MLTSRQRSWCAWALLLCSLVGVIWLASPAAAVALAPSSDEDGAKNPPLTEEIDERSEELDAPLVGRIGVAGTTQRIEKTRENGERPAFPTRLDRPPRT